MRDKFKHNQSLQKQYVEDILKNDDLFCEFLEQLEENIVPAPSNIKEEILRKTKILENSNSEKHKRRHLWLQFVSYSLKVSAGTAAALIFLMFFMQIQNQKYPGTVVKFEGFQKKFEENFDYISYELRTIGDYRMEKSYQERLSKQDDKK
jgi:hypothetical protein